jgi:hypothetical protein
MIFGPEQNYGEGKVDNVISPAATLTDGGDTVNVYCSADTSIALAKGSVKAMLAWLDAHSQTLLRTPTPCYHKPAEGSDRDSRAPLPASGPRAPRFPKQTQAAAQVADLTCRTRWHTDRDSGSRNCVPQLRQPRDLFRQDRPGPGLPGGSPTSRSGRITRSTAAALDFRGGGPFAI